MSLLHPTVVVERLFHSFDRTRAFFLGLSVFSFLFVVFLLMRQSFFFDPCAPPTFSCHIDRIHCFGLLIGATRRVGAVEQLPVAFVATSIGVTLPFAPVHG